MSAIVDYLVINNVLKIKASGAEVLFQWPIKDVLKFDDVFVVLVEPGVGECFNENVYGVKKDGAIIWVIKKRKHVYDDSPYTKILAEDDRVKLFNWDGEELLVEPSTGKVISVGYGK